MHQWLVLGIWILNILNFMVNIYRCIRRENDRRLNLSFDSVVPITVWQFGRCYNKLLICVFLLSNLNGMIFTPENCLPHSMFLLLYDPICVTLYCGFGLMYFTSPSFIWFIIKPWPVSIQILEMRHIEWVNIINIYLMLIYINFVCVLIIFDWWIAVILFETKLKNFKCCVGCT